METEIVNLISQVGFPIFVALYFMFRLETAVKKNTEVLTDLKTIIKERRKR